MLPRSMRSTSGVTTLSIGKCWCGKGRWLQVDPEAEKFYPLSPYNSMGNNPVSMVDPDGDIAFLAVAATYAAYAGIGVAVNGVMNLAQQDHFFQGAVGAAIGGALPGGFYNAGLNAISSHLPSYSTNLGGGFNLSINPAIAFGSQGFTLGANAGLSYSGDGATFGINAGLGYTDMSLGKNSVKGVTGSLGGGFMFGDATSGFGLYSNRTFGGDVGQLVGGVNIRRKGVTLTYENDGSPFNKHDLTDQLIDGHDRWRTNAVSIAYKGVDVRLNQFTGDPSDSSPEPMSGYKNKVHDGGNADMFRLGALSVGYKGQRVGWNSERIRHLFQNKFAHSEHRVFGLKILHNQTYFKNLGGSGSIYSQSSTFSNPYSLWSF